MKPFESYQYLNGTEMTERDKLEVGSKFWNKGKWDNFILPFLPAECGDMTFVDMGCNAGLFLKYAEEKGFRQVLGVDFNEEAVKRGAQWRDQQGSHYRFLLGRMEEALEQLPVADYTLLANAHYYFTINDFLDYLDKLIYKTRYCIIVTAEKHHGNRCWAGADLDSIRRYFKQWKETAFIDELPTEGDPMPRRLWGLCFRSPILDRVPNESLDCGNHVQDEFYSQLDQGIEYHQTKYYAILKPYRLRKHGWSQEKLDEWFEERISVYESVKKEGLLKPVLVGPGEKILDGNHRFAMLRTLGLKTVMIRRT